MTFTALLVWAALFVVYLSGVVVLITYERIDQPYVRWWFAGIAAVWPAAVIVVAVIYATEPDYARRWI